MPDEKLDLLLDFDSKPKLEDLSDKISWKHNPITIFGKNFLEPRLTAWFGPPYSYSSIHWDRKEFPNFLIPLLKKVSATCQFEFNAALLNLYRDGQDSMGWHSDDEPEIDSSCIASLSYGAERKFKLRNKHDHTLKQDLLLPHGSLLVMSNYQSNWQHSIPKTKRPISPRLNITFRKIHTD